MSFQIWQGLKFSYQPNLTGIKVCGMAAEGAERPLPEQVQTRSPLQRRQLRGWGGRGGCRDYHAFKTKNVLAKE